MKKKTILLLVVCSVVFAGMALIPRIVLADQEAGSAPHVVAAEWGGCYAKSVPDDYSDQHAGKTVVYSVEKEADKLITTFDWYARRIHLACNVCDNKGNCGISVIRLGPWHRGHKATKDELAIEFYLNDKLLKKYSTLDIAGTPDNVSASVSHYTLFEDVTGYKYTQDNKVRFVVKTHDGREMSFNPVDGKILNAVVNSELEKQLFVAIEADDVSVVNTLLEKEVNLDAKFADEYDWRLGWTFLHFAFQANNREIMTSLVEKGADINAATHRGETVLTRAIQSSNIDFIQFLLTQGADPNLNSGFQDDTPLHRVASHYNSVAMAKVLVEAGADINAVNTYGNTPLYSAASNYQGRDYAAFLLGKNAGLNTLNNFGETPLHYAARYGQEETVRLLLKKGAQNDIKDQSGKTMHDYLDERGLKIVPD